MAQRKIEGAGIEARERADVEETEALTEGRHRAPRWDARRRLILRVVVDDKDFKIGGKLRRARASRVSMSIAAGSLYAGT